MASNHRKPGFTIAWTTITYRNVVLLLLAFAAVRFISMRHAFPQFTPQPLKKTGDVARRVLKKVTGTAPATGTGVVTTQQTQFSWTAMTNAVGYRLLISRPDFSFTLVDQKVNTAARAVTNLGEGVDYRMVRSGDADGKQAVEREKNRFSLISTDAAAEAIDLVLDPFIQHGRLIEVIGKAPKGERVMVHGSEVPMVNSDGQVHYSTPPVLPAEAAFTATAQAVQGGVNTQQKKIVIQ